MLEIARGARVNFIFSPTGIAVTRYYRRVETTFRIFRSRYFSLAQKQRKKKKFVEDCARFNFRRHTAVCLAAAARCRAICSRFLGLGLHVLSFGTNLRLHVDKWTADFYAFAGHVKLEKYVAKENI